MRESYKRRDSKRTQRAETLRRKEIRRIKYAGI